MSRTKLNSSPNLFLTTVNANGTSIHLALTAKNQVILCSSFLHSIQQFCFQIAKFTHFFPSPLSGHCLLPSNLFLHFCSYLLRVQIPLSSQYKSDHITSLLKILFRIKPKFSTMTYKAFHTLTCVYLSLLISYLSLTCSWSPSHCASLSITTWFLTWELCIRHSLCLESQAPQGTSLSSLYSNITP